MNEVFYISSAVAVVSTLVAITGVNAIHSLLYLIVSFLAIALIFFTLGAPVIAGLIYLLVRNTSTLSGVEAIQPRELGSALFGPYLLGVELASMVLLAGLIGAYHLGRRYRRDEMEERRDELAE